MECSISNNLVLHFSNFVECLHARVAGSSVVAQWHWFAVGRVPGSIPGPVPFVHCQSSRGQDPPAERVLV